MQSARSSIPLRQTPLPVPAGTRFRPGLRLVMAAVLIACCGQASGAGATLGTDISGRPVLEIDGSAAAFIPGLCGLGAGPVSAQGDTARVLQKARLGIFVAGANLGMWNSKLFYSAPKEECFWTGPGEYNIPAVARLLDQMSQASPDGKLIIWLMIGEYPEFGFQNPDEVIRNHKGEALIASTHFLRFDAAPPKASGGNPEHYAISFFSERYRRECAEMLAAFVKAVEASPHGDRVIGYLLGGGQDAQMYSWSPPDGSLLDPANWGDFSPAAQKAFPKWLESRYRNDIARLNAAWGSGLASFAEAKPPAIAQLAKAAPFLDFQKDIQAYDFKRFLAEGRADLLDGFAAAIKQASTHEVVVGASGGDGGHRRDNTSTSRLMRSKHLDFFLHQAAYGVRIPPSVGGINALLDSYTANGKLFLTDMDHRLWTGGKKAGGQIGAVSFTDVSVGRAKDQAMQGDMWRREYARLWVSGNNGAWFNSMGPAAEYDNAELLKEIAFLNTTSNALVKSRCQRSWWQSLKSFFAPPPTVPASDVAFVLDEEAIDYAAAELGAFHAAGMFQQWQQSYASGVPIRYYYAQDLRDGIIPPAKLYVLQNLLNIDEALAARIKELRRTGATIVYLQGTGAVQLAAGRTEFLDDALGIRLRGLNDAPKQLSAASDPAIHPLVSGDDWNAPVLVLKEEKLREIPGLSLTQIDRGAAVLARYPASGFPAITSVENDGAKLVFVGTSTLTSAMISRLAAFAGAWRVAAPGNVIAADKQILMVHPLKTGDVEIVLKKPSNLTDLETGIQKSPSALRHKLALEAGKTYLFSLGEAMPGK